jgi:hypothetical protein
MVVDRQSVTPHRCKRGAGTGVLAWIICHCNSTVHVIALAQTAAQSAKSVRLRALQKSRSLHCRPATPLVRPCLCLHYCLQ